MLGFIAKLFALLHKVRDVGVAELHACKSEGAGGCNVMVWFPECPLFGGKSTLHKHFLICPRIVSTVRSLEVVVSWRLPMYYKYGILNL